jgi:hypothetical protein
MVCIGLEATFNTKELALATTVFFGTMAASKTSSACIARVNDYQRDARRFALVSDERPKLCEGPRKSFVALSLSHRDPLIDEREFFNRDCPLLNKCLVYEMVTDVMVDPPLITRLFLPNAFQVSLGVLRAAGLQSFAKPLVTAATLLDARLRARLAIAIIGELNDAQVNAKNVTMPKSTPRTSCASTGGAEGRSTVTYN